MERYSRITNKNQREIVLLKSFPCAWGKCTFCDYIMDNSKDRDSMLKLNAEILSQVTGEFGVLEVINSGSIFEVPQETLELIKQIVHEKKIKHLFFESHWLYRYKIQSMRDYMGVPITFKIGIESFNEDFRERVLNKNAGFKSPDEIKKFFDSPCLMVGIKGQTREMIQEDIEILKAHFDHGTINVWTNNTTPIKRDDELVQWFTETYKELVDDPRYEVLFHNTDFGVGD